MRKYIVSAFLILICYLAQVSIFPAVMGSGIRPNILIILVASYGFMNGEKSGMAIGFVCGLLADVFSGNVIGMYALLYMLTGYINGIFQRVYYPEDLKLPLALILGSDIGFGFVSYCLLFLLRNRLQIGFYIWNVIIPEAVYTIVIAFAVYPLLLFLHKRLGMVEKRSNE